MRGEILFEKMADISDEYIAEAALGDAYGNPRREKEENPVIRFLNSGWGVAMICAIVSLAAVVGLVRWGRMVEPVGPPYGPSGNPSGQFAFSYEIGYDDDRVWDGHAMPGDTVGVTTNVINQGKSFGYYDFFAYAQFVLREDETIVLEGIYPVTDCGWQTIEHGQQGNRTFIFRIPEDAACGVYDLVLSCNGEEQVFSGVLTVEPVTLSTVVGSYIRPNESTLDNFHITLYADGTYQYYETMVSSHIGLGNYTVENGIITLVDRRIPGLNESLTFTYKFKYSDDHLIFLANESDRFMYLDLPDGAIFERVMTSDGKPIPPGHAFSFGYERPADVKAGDEVQISAWVVNEGEAFTYFGDPYAFQPNATLFCMDDPSYTLIGFPPLTGMEPQTCTIESGEVGKGTYGFRIPEDAPAGEYGLQLTYGEAEARFDSVLTVKSATDAGPALTEEQERAILEAFLTTEGIPDGEPASFRHYYGQFPSGAIIVMIDCGDYTTALWEENVGPANLRYNDGNRIKVFYGGRYFNLPEAYDGKMLTDADLAAVENLHKQYCPYLYADSDGPSDGA